MGIRKNQNKSEKSVWIRKFRKSENQNKSVSLETLNWEENQANQENQKNQKNQLDQKNQFGSGKISFLAPDGGGLGAECWVLGAEC
jgi:hypothetical protein